MKVAVIGSRNLQVWDLENYLPEGTTEIVSGGARGIDTCARRYALAHGLKLTEFLPEYHKYGRGAPLRRNLQIIDYADTVGDTRGSALYFDEQGALREGLPELFRFMEEQGDSRSKVQETRLNGDRFECSWRPVRPIPADEDFFENIWRTYRENKNIY